MSKAKQFKAIIERSRAGMDAAFVKIPFDVKAVFGKTRVKVKVLFDEAEYRGSIAIMDKNTGAILGLTKEIRRQIGKSFGDEVHVEVIEDTEPRVVIVPDDFQKALNSNNDAKNIFDNFAYTHRKEYVNWINEAKKTETRQRRIEKSIKMITSGKKYS